jgi:hypothetical protein
MKAGRVAQEHQGSALRVAAGHPLTLGPDVLSTNMVVGAPQRVMGEVVETAKPVLFSCLLSQEVSPFS